LNAFLSEQFLYSPFSIEEAIPEILLGHSAFTNFHGVFPFEGDGSGLTIYKTPTKHVSNVRPDPNDLLYLKPQ
jgi:hypothetical protein